jgi:hypothetical protein
MCKKGNLHWDWKKNKIGLELKQFDIDKRELIDGDWSAIGIKINLKVHSHFMLKDSSIKSPNTKLVI